MAQITDLLRRWSEGDRVALAEVAPHLYSELRRIAGAYLRRERQDERFQITELAHEAYLRLRSGKHPSWEDRRHFSSIAAHIMRQVLVDHARERSSAKRGSAYQRIALEDLDLETAGVEKGDVETLVGLHNALTALSKLDERKAQIIEMRFFAGHTAEEIGQLLEVSTATVNRDLRLAQAWLRREMS